MAIFCGCHMWEMSLGRGNGGDPWLLLHRLQRPSSDSSRWRLLPPSEFPSETRRTARERPRRVRQSSLVSYSSASYTCLTEVHCMHINLVPKTIDGKPHKPHKATGNARIVFFHLHHSFTLISCFSWQNSIWGSSHQDILIGFPAVSLISKSGKKGKTNW